MPFSEAAIFERTVAIHLYSKSYETMLTKANNTKFAAVKSNELTALGSVPDPVLFCDYKIPW